MDFFGIGIPEIIFILVLALIVLGPRDIEKVGRSIGSFLRRIVVSQEWRMVRDTSEQIREIPTRLMREAGTDFQGTEDELRKIGGELQGSIKDIDLALPATGKPNEGPARKPPGIPHARQAPKNSGPIRIPQGRIDKAAAPAPSAALPPGKPKSEEK